MKARKARKKMRARKTGKKMNARKARKKKISERRHNMLSRFANQSFFRLQQDVFPRCFKRTF